MMSQQDHPDALAQRSQREEKKHGEDTSMNTIWDIQEKTVFMTGGTAGMGYESARGLAARGAKENECNDEYSD